MIALTIHNAGPIQYAQLIEQMYVLDVPSNLRLIGYMQRDLHPLQNGRVTLSLRPPQTIWSNTLLRFLGWTLKSLRAHTLYANRPGDLYTCRTSCLDWFLSHKCQTNIYHLPLLLRYSIVREDDRLLCDLPLVVQWRMWNPIQIHNHLQFTWG